jgi:hypothetical protein
VSPSETDQILNTVIQCSQSYHKVQSLNLGKETGYPKVLSSTSIHICICRPQLTTSIKLMESYGIIMERICPKIYKLHFVKLQKNPHHCLDLKHEHCRGKKEEKDWGFKK